MLWNTTTKYVLKKNLNGWSLTKPRDGNETLSPNDQGTISHMLELTIEKIVQIRHFY
jgi:hypothetical protein